MERKLGKLRQWAGEVVSSNKTTFTEEFKDLESQIDLRRSGVDRMHLAALQYHKALLKKVEVEGQKERIYAIEALGNVFMVHGEDFGSEAAFGQSLEKLGRAYCKIAQLQQDFADSFLDTFLKSLDMSKESMKEYGAQRKKLDSRRLTLDAAVSKLSRAKKDKEKKEAEEELGVARARYEEISDDVQARMFQIQDNEIQQYRDLTTLLEIHLNFASNYRDLLADVKNTWVDESIIQHVEPEKPKVSTHAFKTKLNTTQPESDSDQEVSRKKEKSKEKSVLKRGDSVNIAPNGSIGKQGLSRWVPGSLRRKPRSNSKSLSNLEDTFESEPKEANGSVRSRKHYDELGDGEDESITWSMPPIAKTRSRADSRTSISTGASHSLQSHHAPVLIRRESAQSTNGPRKKARALFDYEGAADELSFRTGDEIFIVAERSGDWWEGELDGRQGLFPSNYVEAIKRPVPPPRPPTLTPSASSFRSRVVPATPSAQGEDHSEEEQYISRPLSRRPSQKSQKSQRSIGRKSEIDTPSVYTTFDEPFGDNQEDRIANERSAKGHEDEQPLRSNDRDCDTPPPASATMSKPRSGSVAGKKAPPPPPIRRSQTPSFSTAASTGRRTPARSKSSGSLPKGSEDLLSPFGNEAEDLDAHLSDGGVLLCSECGCEEFQQNAFKPRGHCSACFHFHAP